MPNLLDSTGLSTVTYSELYAQMKADLEVIYGTDINLDSDSPDGQMLSIYVQAAIDNVELLKQIYTSFDPDQAIGVVLDSRLAINGVQRKAGTNTVTPVSITVSQNVFLYGLDQSVNEIYTVSDNAGTEWQLINTQNIAGAGTYIMDFQASDVGRVLTVTNTITIPVSIVLGVTVVNNPSIYSYLGIDEESDFSVKIRRQKSVSIASQGYLEGLRALILNLDNVSDVAIYENKTGSTNGDGIPSHSIWVIVSGSPVEADLAEAIYKKRNAGCGMYGSESYTITQVDGSLFIINWDYVDLENLYIEFDASSLDGITAPDVAGIKAGLVANLAPSAFEKVNINQISKIAQDADPNALITNVGLGLSGGGPFYNTLTPSSKDKQFAILTGNINITVV